MVVLQNVVLRGRLLLLDLLEVIHHAAHRLLLHRYALLQHMESARNYVQLRDYLLKGLRELLTVAGDSILGDGLRGVSFLHAAERALRGNFLHR